ncbi:hypothetical protein [Luteimonas chenhongjianii]|uniref:hypothetical protein n=1 Tax=Luteimonas chenhongjianii TaxID=2006110 RepID=UPI0012FE4C58|nr:hypothetical protein [Luteimonas chenhongjianii]
MRAKPRLGAVGRHQPGVVAGSRIAPGLAAPCTPARRPGRCRQGAFDRIGIGVGRRQSMHVVLALARMSFRVRGAA